MDGATQAKCLCLVWALEKLQYSLEDAVFEVYTDRAALKSSLNMKTTNRHILRWQIDIQEYRGNMTIMYKEGKSHTNAERLRRWPLDNVKEIRLSQCCLPDLSKGNSCQKGYQTGRKTS
ncbi:hypothetical protein O181_077084 [Austropuccinia psidii MF-1]|uniref:Reverse transcriptase RNase H-like domain-containing protein n=1 Tax=Austropuccinia psidii MF-1 TaxID=1389203 RepID=A0A9Q3IG03_9BASI|nr:hypothetical protein [Austropuccinia psidii MF-1]